MTMVTEGGITSDESTVADPVSVRISVIIPVKSDLRLRDCLDALAHQSLDPSAYEVIVVDDAGDAVTQELVRAASARYLDKAGGAYAARVSGSAAARAPVLAFTDADAVVPRGWLAEIDALFRDAACQAVTGPSSSASDAPVARWIQSVEDGRWERLVGVEDHAVVETRNFAIRREILERVPFDPAFRQAGDLDLGIRLRQAGVRIRVVAALRVAHDHPTSLRVLVAREIRRGRGLTRLERKHGTSRPPQGDRPLTVAGRDLKSGLLGLARRPGWRWIPAGAAALAIATLMPVTWVLARVPPADAAGRRTFIALERAALLFGRAQDP
jgi:cellulose synthase/poly-beta-1,6-N-acetylglucosamine synthase-like glycosyltransferase